LVELMVDVVAGRSGVTGRVPEGAVSKPGWLPGDAAPSASTQQ
jgi:hypothetical protein